MLARAQERELRSWLYGTGPGGAGRFRAALTEIQFHAMDVARRLLPELRLFENDRRAMFDKVCGTDGIRKQLDANRHAGNLGFAVGPSPDHTWQVLFAVAFEA